MVCIYCQTDTRVTNSRHQKRLNQVWRRRRCTGCQTVFTSVEAADLTKSIVVQRSTGLYEPFERDKLMLSVYDAVRHRKTAQEDATALTATIISKLLGVTHQASTDCATLRTVAWQTLVAFDKSAAVHYAAYHPR